MERTRRRIDPIGPQRGIILADDMEAPPCPVYDEFRRALPNCRPGRTGDERQAASQGVEFMTVYGVIDIIDAVRRAWKRSTQANAGRLLRAKDLQDLKSHPQIVADLDI